MDIMQQLMEAVKILHQNNIVHRDINLQNILYSEKTNKLKIIDFGVAKELKNL